MGGCGPAINTTWDHFISLYCGLLHAESTLHPHPSLSHVVINPHYSMGKLATSTRVTSTEKLATSTSIQ